jgi:1,4-dihydroxy-2-naphthoate octaprenyltransferase
MLSVYNILNFKGVYQFTFLFLLPLFIIDLAKIRKTSLLDQLDPFLKKLAIKTLLLTLVFGCCNLI